MAEKKTEVTFGDVATAYLAEHERGWRNEKAPRETAAGAGDLVEGEHLPSGGLDLCRIIAAFPAHRLNVSSVEAAGRLDRHRQSSVLSPYRLGVSACQADRGESQDCIAVLEIDSIRAVDIDSFVAANLGPHAWEEPSDGVKVPLLMGEHSTFRDCELGLVSIKHRDRW